VTGLTERLAQEHRQKFAGGVAAATITAESKPNYYPGNEPVKVKLVIEKATGRLLGAQLASRSDVSKRTDVLAVAITAHMTVEQIGLLDLTYAPPYAPVYDPVLVAANVAARQVG
jgi:NADPH-dependent 2,4-dienoyl-CoA reductase/sulfur reductase-like enzyme